MLVQTLEHQFKSIRDLLIAEIKLYSDKLKESYEEMVVELKKQQNENMKEMEREMLTELVKSMSLEKSIVQKIENKRYERIRCNELMNFMEESNVE